MSQPNPSKPMSQEEIREVYAQGEDAVIALVEGLLERIGQLAMDAMDILPNFNGTSIHDGWSSSAHYDCEHGFCNAHHLRELLFVVERYQQEWANERMSLLVEIKTQVEMAKAAGLAALSALQLADFEQRYQSLVDQGLKDNPFPSPHSKQPPSRGRPEQSRPKNLLDRLSQQSAVLAFMYNFHVPFDNSQAERDLRMMKLRQKISGGFRSIKGAQRFCRIRGYISTLREQALMCLMLSSKCLLEILFFLLFNLSSYECKNFVEFYI